VIVRVQTTTPLRRTSTVAPSASSTSRAPSSRIRCTYADALYKDDAATLDDLREAVTTLEATERTARRVLGGAHPITAAIEIHLQESRAVLAARETPSA
jgi:hypothetical protein